MNPPAPRPAAVPLRHVEHCMGTVFSFDVRAPGVERTALARAVEWLHHVDEVFSPFRTDSVISRVACGALDQAAVPDDVEHVLARCAELGERTGGYFDARAGGTLDPSGYVKGWAIERAADILAAAGSRNHCVNGGGDVQCAGEPALGRPWHVGVADPLHAGGLLDTVAGSGRFAVATSGVAERGHHIVDPHTGRAPTGLAGVTLAGRDLSTVDAYATAAFAMGTAAAGWLAGQPELTWLVVHADGRTETSADRPRPVVPRV